MELVEHGTEGAEHQHGYIHRKDEYLKRLRRIEGQARGLQRMVEDEKYCIDILTQVSAMTSAEARLWPSSSSERSRAAWASWARE